MSLDTDLLIRVLATELSVQDLVTTDAPVSYTLRTQLATGTGAGQADRIFTDTRTLSASATEDLDLQGSLLTPLGTAFTPARVKALVITAASGNTNNVNVTRPASNGVPLFLAASDGVAVQPGGALVLVAPGATGYAVTASTGDLVTVTNSAGTTSVTYNVIIIGSSV